MKLADGSNTPTRIFLLAMGLLFLAGTGWAAYRLIVGVDRSLETWCGAALGLVALGVFAFMWRRMPVIGPRS